MGVIYSSKPNLALIIDQSREWLLEPLGNCKIAHICTFGAIRAVFLAVFLGAVS